MTGLPGTDFYELMEASLGAEAVGVLKSALNESPSVSVRFNPSKIGKVNGLTDNVLPQYLPVHWSKYGCIMNERPIFTLDPLYHAGLYYVQDSSAMFVGEICRKCFPDVTGRPVRVLDLCASPGGKTTDLAASLRQRYGDSFILVSNEVMAQRAGILAENAARWGDPNVVVTNADPSAFAGLEGFFDMIVADVPCSGEGMFRKDEGAVAQWSLENVEKCAARQKRIIADVWPSLRDGGVLVYSTCTFNKYENDLNVKWIASELGASAMTLDKYEGVIGTGCGYSLVPGFVPGEGQYCGALRKEGGRGSARLKPGKSKSKAGDVSGIHLFDAPMSIRAKGDLLVAVPEAVASEVDAVAANVRTIMSGVAVGMLKGKDLVPDADLAMSIALAEDAFPRVELDVQTALKFLSKDAGLIFDGAPSGILLICCAGLPLGFVKNIGRRCNNLLPQARRIRMEVRYSAPLWMKIEER